MYKKMIVFYLSLFAVVLSACASGFAVKESRTVPSDFFGVTPHRYHFEDEGLKLLDDLGLVWLRLDASWSELEREQGRWNFSYLDESIEQNLQNEKKIMVVLGFDTPWIYADTKAHKNISGKELPHYLNYVKTVVTRYKGKIAAWEIWNEPNSRIFWKGNEKDFFELTKQSAQLIREIDPESKIVVGSLSWVPAAYIKRFLADGAAENADAFSYHPYDLNPRRVVALHDKIERLMKKYQFTGELWITETGYPTAGWYPHKVSVGRYPEYIVKTLSGFAVRSASVMIWYELFDNYNRGEEKSKIDSENYFGLAYPNHTRKTGAAAFALCGKYLPNSVYMPELLQRIKVNASIESLLFSSGNGDNTLLLWKSGLGSKRIYITLNGTNILKHSITGETAQPLPKTFEINVDRTPVFITWNGAADTAVLRGNAEF